MNERIALLKPLLTAHVRKLAHRRVVTGEPLVKKGDEGKLSIKERGEIKVALLLVHILNPWEYFRAEEEALLRGTSSDTLSRHRNDLKKL